MHQDQELLDKYQRSVEKLLKHYIDLYLAICSGIPTVYAGKEFIEMYNATYKREIMDVATNIINESASGSSELYYRILKQNQKAVNALFGSVMNLSVGIDSSKDQK